MRPLRKLAVVTLVLSGGTLLGACGIPLDHSAQPVPRSRVPDGLLGAPTPTTTTTTLPEDSTRAVPIGIYFMNSAGTRLVETFARVQPPPTAVEALDLLAYGPTAADSKRGLRTGLSPQSTPRVKVDRQTGIAVVALDSATYYLLGSQEYQALAQIVYTVTDPQFGVHAVQFTYAGAPALAYLPDGQYTQYPVGRNDYAALAPPPVPHGTVTTSTRARLPAAL
jgi:spore germination protein GerM